MQVSFKYDSSSYNSRSPLEVWTEHGIQVLNRVFVRGIPSKMTELQLEILFGGMGYVQNVRIVEDVKTGGNKGYGFVTFRTAEEARKVQEMGLVRWNDKVLQVDVAVKRKAKSRVFKQQYAMPQCTPVYVMAQPDTGLPILMEGNDMVDHAHNFSIRCIWDARHTAHYAVHYELQNKVWCQELNQMLPLENWMQPYA